MGGARTVLLTEWPVADEAMTEWVRAFYRELSRLPPARAAQAASEAVRASWAHPFFWAAATVYGYP